MASPSNSHPEPTDDAAAVTRSAVLPASADKVTDALLDPELLSSWIGPWESEPATGQVSVTTDDGVVRCVQDHHRDDRGSVSWSWHPLGEPEDRSTVVITVAPLEEHSTRVTIHEHRATARASAVGVVGSLASPGLSDRWLPCVLALGALCDRLTLVMR